MAKEKLVLIGPVYPYKGGISHYTGQMYRALAKKFDVELVSYKMQYPKILFHKEQRDYANDMFKVDETQFWINTANPLNWIQTANRINRLEPAAVIIQWWHPYFAPCYQALCRAIRAKKIFVCHNVFPHERFPMDRLLTRSALKKGNAFIVQSKMDEEDLKTIIPNPAYQRTVHPTYNAFRVHDLTKTEAREKLNLDSDKRYLLFFGFVREYKGLKYLIQAMPDVVNRCRDIELLIAGDFRDDRDAYMQLIQETGVSDHIHVCDGYLPDSEVDNYFFASDLVVLPYVSATQSGVIQMAFGFERPVISTNVGGLPDVVTDGETGFLVKPENSRELADAVIRFFEENRADEFTENIQKGAYRFSWDRMTEIIESLVC